MSFPITCTACNKTFTISDEIYEKKVAGRVVTIKCKSCSAGIRVDGTRGAAAPAAGPPAAPASATAEAPPAEAPAAPAATAPVNAPTPAPPEEPLWAVDYPDGQDREFTKAEVVAELARGAVTGSTLVWRDGMAEWLELHQVPELSTELTKLEVKKKAEAAAAAAATTAAAAAKATGPIHKPRAPMPTVTGLGGVPGKGKTQPSPVEAAKPRATSPSAPQIGGARAPAPSASQLTKPRASAASSPELPKPRATAPSAPDLGRPIFQSGSSDLDDDVTQIARPRITLPLEGDDLTPRPVQAPPAPKPMLAPPPPPPVAAPPPAPAAPSAPVAIAPPAPAFVAPTAAAPVAPAPLGATQPLAGLPFAAQPLLDATPPLPASVAQAVSRPPQAPAAFPSSPTPAASFTAPALVTDHATIEWPEAKSKKPLVIGALVVLAAVIGGAIYLLGGKEDVPPPAPISALSPAANAPASTGTTGGTHAPSAPTNLAGSETASGSDPILSPPDSGATPGAGFAELFAAGARKAESKGAAVTPTARFDAAATKAPLAEAATQAQACKQVGGPTGKVTVVVTFDPNGKVSSATINDAPFAGTPTATCISSALKRASIPPFSGLPGTVSKTFSIL